MLAQPQITTTICTFYIIRTYNHKKTLFKLQNIYTHRYNTFHIKNTARANRKIILQLNVCISYSTIRDGSEGLRGTN